jgi:hypothetical protein
MRGLWCCRECRLSKSGTLTGRVVDAKVEADGDIHIGLVDATGNNAGTVSAEIPVGPKWCEIRQTVFGWTTQKFPFGVKQGRLSFLRQDQEGQIRERS